MELLPYKYLAHYVKDGKVVNSEFCKTLEEVNVLRAIALGKGYKFELLDFASVSEPPKEPIPQIEKETFKSKIAWERKVRCVETGKVYASVRDCSKDTGIKYRALINAIKNGTQRNGLHFVSYTSPSTETPKRHKRRVGTWKQRYICVTTNQTFCSASECMAFCGAPVTSFYRALRQGKQINGLLFKKL